MISCAHPRSTLCIEGRLEGIFQERQLLFPFTDAIALVRFTMDIGTVFFAG